MDVLSKILVFALSAVTAGQSAGAKMHSYDVLVYGATAGGVTAAVAAARAGAHVALLEPGRHVGGMVAGGLGRTDMDRQEAVIGGLARQFFERVGRRYGQPVAWTFEPKVAEEELRTWLDEAGVEICFGCRLSKIDRQGGQIRRAEMLNGSQFAAAVFIDSSYEGDLMKAAGVSYTVGREARSKYGESLAGRQDLLPGHHQFRFPVLAFGTDGQLLPWVTPQSKEGQLGEADGKIQSYCFRLCLTDVPSNRLSVDPPPEYRPAQYEMVKRYLESGGAGLALTDFLGVSRLPNGKTDINSNGPVSTDLPGASWEYPDASYERRREIEREHLHWAQGLLYFLQHADCVPEKIRNDALRWGLPKDEFPDTGHWPHQLYVRQARRMLGQYVLTQRDLEEHREKPDSIGIAAYNIDIREVQWLAHKVYRFPVATDEVFMEGYISYPVQPWEIPYRALLPRTAEASNLLVTSCISASTIAYGSFRMEPQYMIAGHSAGVAAAMAARTGRSPARIDVKDLQNRLRQQGQILHVRDIPRSTTAGGHLM